MNVLPVELRLTPLHIDYQVSHKKFLIVKCRCGDQYARSFPEKLVKSGAISNVIYVPRWLQIRIASHRDVSRLEMYQKS